MNSMGCCGQTPKRRDLDELPANPTVELGTEVIYLGSGNRKLRGKTSGLIYYVSDHRRRFFAHSDDLPTILKDRDMMLKP